MRDPHLRMQIFACWCAPIFTLGVLIGWFGLSQGLAPIPADWSAQATRDWFVLHQASTAIGCTIFLVGTIFLAFWVSQFSVMMARSQGDAPVLVVWGRER